MILYHHVLRLINIARTTRAWTEGRLTRVTRRTVVTLVTVRVMLRMVILLAVVPLVVRGRVLVGRVRVPMPRARRHRRASAWTMTVSGAIGTRRPPAFMWRMLISTLPGRSWRRRRRRPLAPIRNRRRRTVRWRIMSPRRSWIRVGALRR